MSKWTVYLLTPQVQVDDIEADTEDEAISKADLGYQLDVYAIGDQFVYIVAVEQSPEE